VCYHDELYVPLAIALVFVFTGYMFPTVASLASTSAQKHPESQEDILLDKPSVSGISEWNY
jgi:fucose permease